MALVRKCSLPEMWRCVIVHRHDTSGRLSPAGAITADAVDCSACLDRKLKVLRNGPSLPVLNQIKNRKMQKIMTPTTCLDR